MPSVPRVVVGPTLVYIIAEAILAAASSITVDTAVSDIVDLVDIGIPTAVHVAAGNTRVCYMYAVRVCESVCESESPDACESPPSRPVTYLLLGPKNM